MLNIMFDLLTKRGRWSLVLRPNRANMLVWYAWCLDNLSIHHVYTLFIYIMYTWHIYIYIYIYIFVYICTYIDMYIYSMWKIYTWYEIFDIRFDIQRENTKGKHFHTFGIVSDGPTNTSSHVREANCPPQFINPIGQFYTTFFGYGTIQ